MFNFSWRRIGVFAGRYVPRAILMDLVILPNLCSVQHFQQVYIVAYPTLLEGPFD